MLSMRATQGSHIADNSWPPSRPSGFLEKSPFISTEVCVASEELSSAGRVHHGNTSFHRPSRLNVLLRP